MSDSSLFIFLLIKKLYFLMNGKMSGEYFQLTRISPNAKISHTNIQVD